MQDTTSDQASAPEGSEPAPHARSDLLSKVVATLNARKGTLREVARAADMSYDTVLRIKNGNNDPSYGKVRRLADVLRIDP